MRSRAARVTLLVVLFAAAGGAAFQLWRLDRDLTALAADERRLDAALAQLAAAANQMRAAQGGYVAPGQQDGPWFERAAALVHDLSTSLDTARTAARSVDAATRLQQLSDEVTALMHADTEARERLRSGDDLMAADVIYRDAQRSVDAMSSMALGLQDVETAAFDRARVAIAERQRLLLGGTTALWALGLILLVRVPKPRIDAGAMAATDESTAAAVATATEPVPQPLSVDLPAAAALCSALSRVADTAALPDLLARAAMILDASGLIVWMAAGEELFAVTAHGYDPRILGRLGPIPRSTDNATATACRLGRVRIVPGTPDSNGAIVAPMFGPAGCFGALAVEVRHGREQDTPTQAVTTMFAAQLATIVAAWPAASAPAPAVETPVIAGEADPALKAAGL